MVVRRVLLEIVTALALPAPLIALVRARAFQDNQGALQLAMTHRLTARTRYFAAKYHWFWQHYTDGEFEITGCSTNEMEADLLTKSLPREVFEKLRKLMIGW
jgi:hypothetical protein